MAMNRAWVFTCNNYSNEDIEKIRNLGAQYYVFGKEVGDSGTPHLQGYVYFKSARRFTAMKKKLPNFHLEPRYGTHLEARKYCIKDGDFEEAGEEPEKNGGDKIQERIAKNKRLREQPIEELLDDGTIGMLQVPQLKKAKDIVAARRKPYQHTDVRGVWIWGPPGVGKTHYARTKFGDDIYIKAQNKWFDGYEDQKNIVLDDFDLKGECLSHLLKIWADKWPATGEVKGGHVNLQHEKFIITSNYRPSDIWPLDYQLLEAINRRFEIIHKQTRD